MAGVRDCLDRLEVLVKARSATPQDDAVEIVRDFREGTNSAGLNDLRKQLETDWAWRRQVQVTSGNLTVHSHRLEILEAALKTVR
jgi:hypothetical protein